MGHGFSLTQDDGLELYARTFTDAGLTALSFDYRFFGDSEVEPRQRFDRAAQRQDWLAAHEFAGGLERVDGDRIIPWGYSFGAGHLMTLLTRRRMRPAAALVLAPFVDGLRRIASTPPGTIIRVLAPAILDTLGLRRTIPVTAKPSSLGAMNLPGEAAGFARVVPDGSRWRNEVTAGVFATVALHRPWLRARRIDCPLWVGLGEKDITTDPDSIRELARRAPRGELHRYAFDHFEPFLPEPAERIAADQIAFLERVGLAG
jgi:pimeloyl-ACP methyl ester carboxylesterase